MHSAAITKEDAVQKIHQISSERKEQMMQEDIYLIAFLKQDSPAGHMKHCGDAFGPIFRIGVHPMAIR